MALNSEVFIHESDRAALQALKAIPGFSQVIKAYMSVWNERQFRILNMSSNLRVSEKQLKKYYDMLPPICERLGIEIPELYIEQDGDPNAYTYGDTKPFIVLTTGLFEAMPERLIPTVLAHECGHIACRHTMFRTMGSMILNGMLTSSALSSLLTLPLQTAFAYWMRCSEFSADRAAALCNGSSENMIEVCMRFAGFMPAEKTEDDVSAFMEQALEYKEMVTDSKWNKTLEFMMFSNTTHPLNAVRAYECDQWTKTSGFRNAMQYIVEDEAGTEHKLIPMEKPSSYYVGKNYHEVLDQFYAIGFRNVYTERIMEKGLLTRKEQVTKIAMARAEKFSVGDWFEPEIPVNITYFEPETESEYLAAHAGQLMVPNAPIYYLGKSRYDVIKELSNSGFQDLQLIPVPMPKRTWLRPKEDSICKITFNGSDRFAKGSWYEPDVVVGIHYYAEEV